MKHSILLCYLIRQTKTFIPVTTLPVAVERHPHELGHVVLGGPPLLLLVVALLAPPAAGHLWWSYGPDVGPSSKSMPTSVVFAPITQFGTGGDIYNYYPTFISYDWQTISEDWCFPLEQSKQTTLIATPRNQFSFYLCYSERVSKRCYNYWQC